MDQDTIKIPRSLFNWLARAAVFFFFLSMFLLVGIIWTKLSSDMAEKTGETGSETGTETMSDTGNPCQEFEGQPPAEGDDVTPYEWCLSTSE